MRLPRLGVTAVCTAIAIAVAAVRLLAPVPLEVLDRKFLDFRHLVRGPVAASDQIVIVAIDERSLARLGRWPWPRARLAELIGRLDAAGVTAVGVDVVLDQPATAVDRQALEAALDADPRRPAAALRDVLRDELNDDARLAAALQRSGHVVLAHFFEFDGAPAPDLAQTTAGLPELTVLALGGARLAAVPGPPAATRARLPVVPLAAAAAATGHINFAPDPDGIYRRLPIAVRVGDRLIPPLSLELVRVSRGGAPSVTVDQGGIRTARLGDLELPVDGAGQLWLDFLGPPQTVATVSAADVLDGQVPADRLAGRIALVGFTAAGFDEVTTPFAAVVPGVEVQATVLDNVLGNRLLRRPWWLVPAEAAVVVLLGVIVGPALRWLRGGWGTIAAMVLAAAYFWVTQALFTTTGLALGGLYPLAALVLCVAGGAAYLSVVEEGEKRRIRSAFRHYVNPEIADLIARDPSRLRLGGERRPISVLFSDIRGFTSIAEHLPPETLGEMLGQYLEAMTDTVFAHGGLLDKYIGDAVMAFWGSPVQVEDHATRCCRAALDMLAALKRLNRRWHEAGLPRLHIRIGIGSGNAIVGNFGSSRRFSYTAVGDTVNLASRLEHLNKEFGTSVLISNETRAALGDEFVCREVGRITVRGRVQPSTVHELVGRRSDVGDASPQPLTAAGETTG